MFIIYSVYNQHNTPKQNLDKHLVECKALQMLGVDFTECVGVYKGAQELSIRVSREFGDLVKSRAWDASQECILVVNQENKAFLVYPKDVNRLGTWQAVPTTYKGDHTLIDGKKYTVL